MRCPSSSATPGLTPCAALLDLGNDRLVLDDRENHWIAHLELPLEPLVQTAIHRSDKCVHHLTLGPGRPSRNRDLGGGTSSTTCGRQGPGIGKVGDWWVSHSAILLRSCSVEW